MKLSVIIVNYNVRAYLEQCLRTVQCALEGIESEVFVVDNLSTDGSVELVRTKFPDVRLIANQENVGFSRANNQAIRACHGEYVLLLNPDTVVGEDVFRKVIDFLDAHPKAGGLGVKMIDGTGRFLPESKRGLPTPSVAFFKIIGLTRLFPRSKLFGRYHLGHLPENEAAPIEILSGACMFLRKRTLDEVGLLDESFFMYGEDIDLSYRITLGGYQNWYFPAARIIHYKGESTKKSSVNYVFVFYNAMAIFAKKHFTRRRTDLLSLLITGSIYLSAAGAILMRFLRRWLLPALDLALLFLITLIPAATDALAPLPTTPLWAMLLMTGVPMIALLGLSGAYDKPILMGNVVKGGVAGGVLAQLLLWLAPEATATATPLWPITVTFKMIAAGAGSRLLLHFLDVKSYNLRRRDRQHVLAIGSEEEAAHTLALLWQTHFGLGRRKRMGIEEASAPGAARAIALKLREHRIDELIFCARDLPWRSIIALMEALRGSGAVFKIAQPGREFIIGPNSMESLQDLHVLDIHALNSSSSRRAKRAFDVTMAVGLLLSFPITAAFMRHPSSFLRNIVRVLKRQATWVGYCTSVPGAELLPPLLPGILDPVRAQNLPTDDIVVERVNTIYAKDYHVLNDLRWTLRGLRALGG